MTDKGENVIALLGQPNSEDNMSMSHNTFTYRFIQPIDFFAFSLTD